MPFLEQQAVIDRVLRSLLECDTSCALVGYPDHWNVGDAAIWCGTRRLLSRMDRRVAYACDPWSYDPRLLEKALPDGPILLAGGGNFGDVYPDETGLRRRVLTDLPHRRIIQLPQSIWFRTETGLAALQRLLEQQRDFTLLVRDGSSLAFAQKHFPVRSLLCPDLAVALDFPHSRHSSAFPVLALWRDDIEASHGNLALPSGWEKTDWMEPGPEWRSASLPARVFHRVVEPPPYGTTRRPPRRSAAWRMAPGLWEKLAHERVRRGCRILQQGRVVLTNRLHAHVLCVGMGIPHVACDTANGKISAYGTTWPLDDPNAAWARTPVEAIERAREMLGAMPGFGTSRD